MRGTFILFLHVAAAPALARPGAHYRAAVVEIDSWDYRKTVGITLEAASQMKSKNAALMDKWTAKAAAAGAQIVVFGEQIANSADRLPNDSDAPQMLAEPLPQPGPESLCTGDAKKSRTQLADELACIAKKHNITLVTGTGDIGPCVKNHLSPMTQTPFPCDDATGLAYFNSIAVFGPQGNLLAKYHKSHLSRTMSGENEFDAAGVEPPEVVTFDTPFGVRFGVIICEDGNYGGPVRGLLKAGVRDILMPMWNTGGGALGMAVGRQDESSRAYGINFLVSSGGHAPSASGSGIFPADLAAPAPQFYASQSNSPGWIGVADLVSPDPADTPVPAEAHSPSKPAITAMDPPLVFTNDSASSFEAVAGGKANLTASADGLLCSASVTVASGSGPYALIAMAGLDPNGWYSAKCALVNCKNLTDCPGVSLATLPLAAEGAVFSDVQITFTSKYGNTFRHSAICDGGLTVRPRTALTLHKGDGGARVLSLSKASCPLVSAYVDIRAQSEDERARCPNDEYPCSTDRNPQHNLAHVNELWHAWLQKLVPSWKETKSQSAEAQLWSEEEEDAGLVEKSEVVLGGPTGGISKGMYQNNFDWKALMKMTGPKCNEVCRGKRDQCYPIKRNGFMGPPCGVLSAGPHSGQGCFQNGPTQTCALCDIDVKSGANGVHYCCPTKNIKRCKKRVE